MANEWAGKKRDGIIIYLLLTLTSLSWASGNHFKVSCIFFQEKLLSRKYILRKLYVNQTVYTLYHDSFCYPCLRVILYVNIYKSTLFFFTTAWYSNIWVSYECPNIDVQYLAINKPFLVNMFIYIMRLYLWGQF